MLVDNLALNQRQHAVTAAETEQPDLEKRYEKL
jgi:hypothetical protein